MPVQVHVGVNCVCVCATVCVRVCAESTQLFTFTFHTCACKKLTHTRALACALALPRKRRQQNKTRKLAKKNYRISLHNLRRGALKTFMIRFSRGFQHQELNRLAYFGSPREGGSFGSARDCSSAI